MMDRPTPRSLTRTQAARFSRLVMPHLETLLRTATILTRHEQEAEDLVQDAAVKAMRAIDSFREGTDIKAWLMTILRHAHVDRVRAGRRHADTVSIEQNDLTLADPRPEADAADERWNTPADLLERFGDDEVIEALQGLPEEIRWTLLLVDVEQMDHAAAAVVLEVPTGTIKSRAHRGRAMLRDRLGRWAAERGWTAREESSHGIESEPH